MIVLNIGLYGDTDKRPIVFALLKLLQDIGTVLFVTRERHYSRLIDKEEFGYFQNILICTSDVSPDYVFDYIEVNPESFDFILFDISTYIPDDLDLVVTCTSYRDELLVDEMALDLPEPLVQIKLMFDGKRDKDYYNIKPTAALYKYIELVESYKILPPFRFRDISIFIEKEIGSRIDLDSKTIQKILAKEWSN